MRAKRVNAFTERQNNQVDFGIGTAEQVHGVVSLEQVIGIYGTFFDVEMVLLYTRYEGTVTGLLLSSLSNLNLLEWNSALCSRAPGYIILVTLQHFI